MEGSAPLQEELVRVLNKAVEDLGLGWESPDEPAKSKLDAWFLQSGRRAAAQRKRAPFFPDVYDELVKAWDAPQSPRTHAPGSAIFTELALPSKPCRMTAHLAERAYAASGKAASALHTMPVLQVFQAQLLRSLDGGEREPGRI